MGQSVNPPRGASMAERFSDIEKPLVSNQPSLEERLKEYPELKGKIEAMLAIIENEGGDVEKAAEAERRIIEELRQARFSTVRWIRSVKPSTCAIQVTIHVTVT
jgi:hypothetical protein